MKRRGLVLVLLLLVAMPPHVALATAGDVRQKPGPATIRGVVRHAGASTFTLTTATKGTFDVRVRPATTITVRGGHGKTRLNDGDHVGVRGFVHGRQVIAISVRVYPTKPKVNSLTGTVVTATGGRVVVASSGHQVSVQITSATTGDAASASGSGIRLHVGDRVRFRVVQVTQGLVALSIHIFHPHVAAHHVQLHGTLTVNSPSSITVRAGTHTYPVGLTSQTRVYLGSGQASPRSLHSGDTVTVFACCDGQALRATSIHARTSRNSGAHLKVLGVVTALTGNRISVLSGSRRYVMTAGSTTRVYVGARAVSTRDLRVGQSVTVFACCGPQSQMASSIHVRVVKAPQRSSLVRGMVTSVTGNRVRLAVGAGQVDVELQASTTYDRGGGSATKSDLRPGVSVSVRGHVAGSGVRAQRIHIFVTSLRSQRIKGTVVSASRSTVIARAGGKVYMVDGGARDGDTQSRPCRSLRAATGRRGARVRAARRWWSICRHGHRCPANPD
ncbi:MAG: hypothetical protein NVS2B16_11010 [Chloroflexota bacterium]